MALLSNCYTGYDLTTSTGINNYTTIGGVYVNEPVVPAAKPKKKTFDQKLQVEIDSWLKEFN